MEPDNHSNAIDRIPWAHLRVPPVPQLALRVLDSIEDDSVSMHRLSDMISSDPAFSSEVLTIANSSLVPHRLAVTSVLQAVALMGTCSLKGVCLAVGVRANLVESMVESSLRTMWRHSLACGLIAEQLALAGWVENETAYTAGILHQIGPLALAALYPEQYAGLLETHCGTAPSMLEAERAMFGFDHCQAAQRLVTAWGLPLEFEPVMCEPDSTRHHHEPWNLAELIHTSCRMAVAAGFPAFPGCVPVPFPELLSQLPVRERSLFHADIKDLAEDIGGRIKAIESF